MNDRERLHRMLKDVARKPKLRRIVCYDAAWAGLPRITVNDRPKRQNRRLSYIGSRSSARPKAISKGRRERAERAVAVRPSPAQMELAL